MGKRPWRVGWSPDNRRFYFRAPSGYSMTLSGSRKNVVEAVLQILPKMLDVAKKAVGQDNNPEFIAAIEAALVELRLPLTPGDSRDTLRA